MSYGRHVEKKYVPPHPPAGLKGKPGFKPKGQYEKDVIEKASKELQAKSEESKGE